MELCIAHKSHIGINNFKCISSPDELKWVSRGSLPISSFSSPLLSSWSNILFASESKRVNVNGYCVFVVTAECFHQRLFDWQGFSIESWNLRCVCWNRHSTVASIYTKMSWAEFIANTLHDDQLSPICQNYFSLDQVFQIQITTDCRSPLLPFHSNARDTCLEYWTGCLLGVYANSKIKSSPLLSRSINGGQHKRL